ncbi:hypothetical protein ES708_33252 [subsurface metagenome]
MAETLKERIARVAALLGEIYRGLVIAKTTVELFGSDVQEQEDKIMDHLDAAREHIGLAEAEVLALAAMTEDGRTLQD